MAEGEPLLGTEHAPPSLTAPQQLSVMFAVACIVDQFGINPVIVLTRAIILCGKFRNRLNSVWKVFRFRVVWFPLGDWRVRFVNLYGHAFGQMLGYC